MMLSAKMETWDSKMDNHILMRWNYNIPTIAIAYNQYVSSVQAHNFGHYYN